MTGPANKPGTGTETRIVGGSLWMISMRWTMRLIGLVSTIVLARLLTADDFGLVAMALIVVGLMNILADAGVDLALLRDREASKEHWDTAWTIQVIQGIIVAVLLLLAIDPAARYFDEPRVRAALLVLAARPAIEGFRNIGIVAFRKELDFAKEFRFNVFQKLATFVIVMTLALLWRNYWAMIVGSVATGFISVAISYAMHAYRPRFSLGKAKEIWSFSQWLLLSRIGVFGNRQTDKFVVGGTAGTSSMGDYHIAKEIGSMLANELIFPIRRALFPNFAIIVASQQKLEHSVLVMLSFAATMIVGVQFGLASVAPDFVAVVLGERWTSVTGLLRILAFAGTATSTIMLLEFLLPITNQARLAAFAAWLELAVLIPVLLFMARGGDLEAVATGRLAVAIFFVPVMFLLISRKCDVRLMSMIGCVWRPLIAGTVMFVSVQTLYSVLNQPPAVRLAITVLAGAATYCMTVAMLWFMAGRPIGMENEIWKRLRSIR